MPIDGPLSPDAERDLMGRLAAGDEVAIRDLYRRFGRTVFALGLRMLGSLDQAEEMTQDVFVAVWRKAGRYDPARGRLSTWLMAIAHNLAVDRLRRRRVTPLPVSTVEDVHQEGLSEEDETLDREEARRILVDLSAAERKLLVLTYYRGWTAREIAESHGIPLGTVKTRLRTALIKLRRAHLGKEA